MSSIRDKLLAKRDLPRKRVETPELGEGDYVVIGRMSGTLRDKWEASMSVSAMEAYRARLVAYCAIDEVTGERLFTDEEIPTLAQGDSVVLCRLFDAAAELNAIGKAAAEKEKGNSVPSPGDASSSG